MTPITTVEVTMVPAQQRRNRENDYDIITDYLLKEPPPKRNKHKKTVDDNEIVKDGSETKS